MWFHKHKWKEVERFYTQSYDGTRSISGAGQDLLRQVIFGMTTILYRCDKCHEMLSIEILGKSENK